VQAASLQKILKAEMRARIRIAHTLHLEKLPYGVPLEKICRRRRAQSPASGTDLCNQMLELTEGFEPPTL
jgi:hypothetical protein